MIPTNLELPSLTEQHTKYVISVHHVSSAKYTDKLTTNQPFFFKVRMKEVRMKMYSLSFEH